MQTRDQCVAHTFVKNMKKKSAPLIESISESSAACLITMVQGNLLALTLGHVLIASQTGVIAGAIAAITILIARAKVRWVISIILGSVTTVVDFFVHPGQFGPVAAEAVVTGVAAGLLSYLIGTATKTFKQRRRNRTDS